MKPKFYIPILILNLLPLFLKAQGLIIPSNAYIISGNGNIVLQSNWTNNGTFTHNSGTVIFGGTVQTLGGTSSTTFNNITVASTSNTTIITAGHTLKAILLSNDTLNAGGNLTLLSTASQTALIDGTGTGEVLGNVAIQRYLASGFGYKYFSSPFLAATVNEFSDDINFADTFPPFYRYDENLVSSGWVIDTITSNLLTPTQGYNANFGSSSASTTADITGVVNNHTLSATLYNHNRPYTLGFNLVGNPYPSPVDWDLAGGWTRTNIDNAVYYFNAGTTNQYTGTYSSYINGVSSNGTANNIIAAMQGFFIHVSNGTYPVTATFSVNNNARINNLVPNFYRAPPLSVPLLRLTAAFDGGISDAVVIYFADEAISSFDREKDALKIMNTDSQVPNLYALSTDAARLSIISWPATYDSTSTIPLGLQIKHAGSIIFNTQDMERIPYGQHIYLYDAKTGKTQDLQSDPQYRLFLEEGTYENRFSIVFHKKDNGSSSETGTTVYSINGKLYVYLKNIPDAKCSISITNLLGQTVLQKDLYGNGYHELGSQFSSGLYIVSFYTKQHTFSKKVVISK
ncbi:Por secretion system C-terminal sorting domain-containing protein [Chitinophaga sp. CF118]|uniref:T9SS type A sorting domain-containing protein n=1 Tax=Chitinophaga sp. CF118 TaxID=1884367 RepID=UPI0008E43E05|nr:T9SS type A sorting domain-containing protein [Chitinophaga sp. CF118]SFD78887.1 Por secretion system C-terminal sorting domain-containing protein [Chitinophaga sp. CF118]